MCAPHSKQTFSSGASRRAWTALLYRRCALLRVACVFGADRSAYVLYTTVRWLLLQESEVQNVFLFLLLVQRSSPELLVRLSDVMTHSQAGVNRNDLCAKVCSEDFLVDKRRMIIMITAKELQTNTIKHKLRLIAMAKVHI